MAALEGAVDRHLPVRVDVDLAALHDRVGQRDPARVLCADHADERHRPEQDQAEHDPFALVAAEPQRSPTASSQSKWYSKRSGSSASAWARPASYSSGLRRSKVENARDRMMSSACARVVSRCWRSCSTCRRRNPAPESSCSSACGAREALALDRRHRREEPREPDLVEGGGILGGDRDPAAWCEHTGRLRERSRPVDQVDDHPHHDRVEPARLERKRLRERDLRVDVVLLGPCHHRLRRVDRPDPGELARFERGGEPAGAAPDLEHACCVQLAEPDELDEDLPPVVVDRPELLVPRGAEVEPGRRIRSTRRRFLLVALGPGAGLDERGLAALAKRHLDDVEVSRQDRRREHLARLARAGRLRSSAARCASARAARHLRHVRSPRPEGPSSGRSPARGRGPRRGTSPRGRARRRRRRARRPRPPEWCRRCTRRSDRGAPAPRAPRVAPFARRRV